MHHPLAPFPFRNDDFGGGEKPRPRAVARSETQQSAAPPVGMVRLRPPPGIELEPGEYLSVYDTLVEWIAYVYETRVDVFLIVKLAAALYDVVWTPCLWLLPIEVGWSRMAVGFGIDALIFLGIIVGILVWGMQDRCFQILLDAVPCMPWELIGLATEAQEPLLPLRSLAKVPCWARAHTPTATPASSAVVVAHILHSNILYPIAMCIY